VFGVVVHAVHYTLLYGGLAVLALLLVHSRPGASRRVAGRHRTPSEHDLRVERLREAVAHGRPGDGLAAPRLVSQAPPDGPARPHGVGAPGDARGGAVGAAETTWLPVAVVSSVAAAGVHAAAGPAHFGEGLVVGGFFVVCALAQLGWAIAVLLVGPARPLLWGALVGNAGVVLVWLASRTVGVTAVGLPVEAVGAWDLAATGWEVAVVAGVSLVLSSGRFTPPPPRLLDIVRWSAAALVWLAGSVTLLLFLTVTGPSS
jgi:hypothetical protein